MKLSGWNPLRHNWKPSADAVLIFSILLFFPKNNFVLYALVMAILIFLCALRAVKSLKTASISSFTVLSAVINAVLLISCFFSHNPHSSFLQAADVLLISFYLNLPPMEKSPRLPFKWFVLVITASSAIHSADQLLGVSGQKSLFFGNPILQGITSGIAVLILFQWLLENRGATVRFLWGIYFLLAVNVAGIYISQSKAAFIGVGALALIMALAKARKLLPWVAGFILLTLLIPNPIREMFIFSLYKDPYAANRIDIWKSSAKMALENAPLGVGLNNFAWAAPKYNFRQERGAAHYFKVPEKSHNDYLKILSELGLAGIFLLVFTGFVLGKKLLAPPRADIVRILIFYLLFQACLFNLLLEPFFLFIFLLSLRQLLGTEPAEPHVIPVSGKLKAVFVFFLTVLLAVGYIFPFLTQHRLERAASGGADALATLENTARISPLDAELHVMKARLLLKQFQQTGGVEIFYEGLEALRKARRCNRYHTGACSMETDFFLAFASKVMNYEGIWRETVAPLDQAMETDPFNPFLRLRKAEILTAYHQKEAAVSEAQKALELEPEYVAALCFLHDQTGDGKNSESFLRQLEQIREKARRIQPEPGSYLEKLFAFPVLPPETLKTP